MAEGNPTARDDDNQGKGKGKLEVEAEGSGDIVKLSRHKHELLRDEDLQVYTCRGCKELGANIGYMCKTCDSKGVPFLLHELCFVLPDEIQHPFDSKTVLKFRPKTKMVHHCTCCREKLEGYVFETAKRDIRLHPLCMMLPKLLNYSEHADHELKIVTGDLKGKEYKCSNCHRVITRGGWRYRCEGCKFYIDPICAKEEIFGLPDHALHSKSGGKRKTAAVFFKSIIGEAAATLFNAIIDGVASEIIPNEIIPNQTSEQQKATDGPSQEG